MEKILIVDDSSLNRGFLTKILQEYYEILTAENGQTALSIAQKELPTLILLDIIMPEIDGFQVLEKLKGWERTKNIPVIFITGLANAKDEERGLLCGAVDYITKPFTPGIVKARVQTHVQLVTYQRALEALTMIDSLTGIANRRSYEMRAKFEWAHAARDHKPLSMAVIDIDFFKQYNDHYGHAKGDYILKKVVKAMLQVARRQTDFLARYGGEEFVVIMPDTPAAGACYLAELIRSAVEEANIEHLPTNNKKITISIGGATIIPQPGQSFQAFFETADQMLYWAKGNGRNRVEWKIIG